MNAFVAVTDTDWFDSLRRLGSLDEVNFWQPSAGGGFRALAVGEPFLFKLHSPDDYIVGGGFFSYWTRLPVGLAWDTFGNKNGASSLVEMRERIERYRRTRSNPLEDYEIGCILLAAPFFLRRRDWLRVPGWHSNIVRGRGYDLTTEPGRTLWRDIEDRLKVRGADHEKVGDHVAEAPQRYGDPLVVRPRLGQGTFRVIVTDAYGRRCAVTSERVLPVLTAAHIRPFADGGEHRVDNGLLLRSDFHALFDRGYITVTLEYNLLVSRRLRADFDNGQDYLEWHGRAIRLPERSEYLPNRDFLAWHNESRFRG